MTTTTPTPDSDENGRTDGLVAVVDAANGVPECTLFPPEADDIDLLSCWMTARGDAFVSLESIR